MFGFTEWHHGLVVFCDGERVVSTTGLAESPSLPSRRPDPLWPLQRPAHHGFRLWFISRFESSSIHLAVLIIVATQVHRMNEPKSSYGRFWKTCIAKRTST